MDCKLRAKRKAKKMYNMIPCRKNSDDVVLTPKDGNCSNLIISRGNQQVDIIDCHKNKRFIRFTFPEGFSDFSVRVFEESENDQKLAIINAYEREPQQGFTAFDAQWEGLASSGRHERQFVLKAPQGQTMVLRNKHNDAREHDTYHTFILSFVWQGDRYLVDPRIRNKKTR